MKLKFLGFIPALLLLLASCSENDNPGANSYGKINANITANNTVSSSSAISRDGGSTALTPELNNFSLKISKKDGSFSKSWANLGEYDVNQKFATGSYDIEVNYGSIDDEGFDKPCYHGSTEFQVFDSETAQPQVEAVLTNTMISINYTEAFKKYFTDYSATIHSDGGAYIDFVKDELRNAYVRPGNISLQLTLTKTNGVTFTFNPADIANAKPRTHYNVTFDVNGGEVGDAQLVIRFDSTTETEPITINLSDELIYAPAPVLNPIGYQNGVAINLFEGDAAPSSLKANLIASAGLKEVTLTTSSAYLISKGWPAEANLMALTEAQKTLMQNLGLKVTGLWNRPDKIGVVDFTDLIKNLRVLNNSTEHLFTIQIKDIYTKVSEPVQLKVETAALQLGISDMGLLVVGQTSCTAKLTYNGSNVAESVTMQVLNASGAWENCAMTKIESIGNNQYNITLAVPAVSQTLKLRALYKNSIQSSVVETTPTNPAYTISMTSDNIWPAKATLNLNPEVASLKEELTNFAQVYIKSADGAYVKDANVVKDAANGAITINGLTPGTSYVVKVTVDGGANFSNEYPFSTESPVQIGFSNMESWYSAGSGSYWNNLVCGVSGQSRVWDTMNALTTSEGIDAAYCRSAGTISTTDKNSGTNAALIRTVGWGSGNTAAGSASVVYNTNSGELYTGVYDSSAKAPNYGIAFTSRPAALEFYYKYTPTTKVSGDYMVAKIVIMDKDNNIIGQGSYTDGTNLTAYTKKTVNVTYTSHAKAAKMYVSFKSSGNSNCVKRDALNLPGFGLGYKDHVSTGSQLFIDDVTLKY